MARYEQYPYPTRHHILLDSVKEAFTPPTDFPVIGENGDFATAMRLPFILRAETGSNLFATSNVSSVR